MAVAWDRYLNGPIPQERFAECRRRCFAAFAEQRENILRVFEATAPRSIACLGAGSLNDIPYQEFVRRGAELHLVDWLPDATLNGIDLSIVDRTDAGEPRCLYCDPSVAGRDYCEHFRRAEGSDVPVCELYVEPADGSRRCREFAKGARPILHQADVTGGYADAFGRQVSVELRGVRDWKDGLTRGIALARRVEGRRAAPAIPDQSIDLVTSSMLLTQFENEPFQYLSTCVAALVGRPTPREEAALQALVEEFRDLLLNRQMEGHFQEIRRLLAPGGRCYLSFELFRRLEETNRWFVVAGMPRALEIAGRYFQIRFDLLPDEMRLSRFSTDEVPSLACSLVLEAADE